MKKRTIIHIKIPYWIGKAILIEVSLIDEEKGCLAGLEERLHGTMSTKRQEVRI